jgi:hypothetical protein
MHAYAKVQMALLLILNNLKFAGPMAGNFGACA